MNHYEPILRPIPSWYCMVGGQFMSAGPCIGRDRPAGGAFSNAADLFGDEISMSVASVVVSKFHLLQSVCTDIDTLYVVPAKTDLEYMATPSCTQGWQLCQIILFSGAQFNQQDTDPLILELLELSKLVASILLISILLKPTAGCWKKNIRRRRACSATSSTSISAPWAKLGPVAATCGSYVWKIYFGIMIRTYRHTEHTWISMVFHLLPWLLKDKAGRQIPRDSFLEGGVVFGRLFLAKSRMIRVGLLLVLCQDFEHNLPSDKQMWILKIYIQ